MDSFHDGHHRVFRKDRNGYDALTPVNQRIVLKSALFAENSGNTCIYGPVFAYMLVSDLQGVLQRKVRSTVWRQRKDSGHRKCGS